MTLIRPYRILLAAILCCLFTSPALALDPWKPLPTCQFGMPYMGKAVEKGQRGVITAVLRAVFEHENIRLRHIYLPYDRAVERTRQGKIQCTMDVGARQNGLIHGKYPLFFFDLGVARLRTTPWKGLKSIKGKRVATRHGLNLISFLPVSFTPQHLFSLTSAFSLLDEGLVTYALDDMRLLRRAMFDSGVPSHFFSIDPIRSYPIYPVFTPSKEGRHLCDVYNRRMEEMVKSGDLIRVLEKNEMDEKQIRRILEAQ